MAKRTKEPIDLETIKRGCALMAQADAAAKSARDKDQHLLEIGKDLLNEPVIICDWGVINYPPPRADIDAMIQAAFNRGRNHRRKKRKQSQ